MSGAAEIGISEQEFQDAINLEKLYGYIKKSGGTCGKCGNSGVVYTDINNVEFLCRSCGKGKEGCKRIGDHRFKKNEIEKFDKKFGSSKSESKRRGSESSDVVVKKSKSNTKKKKSSKRKKVINSSSEEDSDSASTAVSEPDSSSTEKEVSTKKPSSKSSKKEKNKAPPSDAEDWEMPRSVQGPPMAGMRGYQQQQQIQRQMEQMYPQGGNSGPGNYGMGGANPPMGRNQQQFGQGPQSQWYGAQGRNQMQSSGFVNTPGQQQMQSMSRTMGQGYNNNMNNYASVARNYQMPRGGTGRNPFSSVPNMTNNSNSMGYYGSTMPQQRNMMMSSGVPASQFFGRQPNVTAANPFASSYNSSRSTWGGQNNNSNNNSNRPGMYDTTNRGAQSISAQGINAQSMNGFGMRWQNMQQQQPQMQQQQQQQRQYMRSQPAGGNNGWRQQQQGGQQPFQQMPQQQQQSGRGQPTMGGADGWWD